MLLPDPNAGSAESAKAVVVAAANKEVVAVLCRDYYYFIIIHVSRVQIMKSLLLTLLLYCM